MTHVHGSKEILKMSKTNYNKMYKNEEVVTEETPVEEVVTPSEEDVVEESVTEEAPVEEVVAEEEPAPVEEPVKVEAPAPVANDVMGTVSGTALLNVRKTPGGEVATVLKEGDKVKIEDNTNPDWFEISSPVHGFVMKKYIKI